MESLLKIAKDRQIETEQELAEYRMEKFTSIASAEVERQDLETELRNTQLQLEAEEKRSQGLQVWKKYSCPLIEQGKSFWGLSKVRNTRMILVSSSLPAVVVGISPLSLFLKKNRSILTHSLRRWLR